VVPQRTGVIGELGVIGCDHAAGPRCHNLRWIKGDAGDIGETAGLSSIYHRSMRMRDIFDKEQTTLAAELTQSIKLRVDQSADVNRNDARCPGVDPA